MTKFRCSKLGDLMTPPRAKKDILSKTCTDYLDEIFIEQEFGRTKDISSKYIEKGLAVEDDSIALYSDVCGEFFVKNEERRENEYITGTPDIAPKGRIIDVKSSWDIFTFSKADLTKSYYWQLMGYMWLWQMPRAELVYCLVNAPEDMIQDELRRLSWKMMMIDTEDPVFQAAEKVLRHNMIFDDIPPEKRVKKFVVDFDEQEIERLKAQSVLAREYLNQKKGL